MKETHNKPRYWCGFNRNDKVVLAECPADARSSKRGDRYLFDTPAEAVAQFVLDQIEKTKSIARQIKKINDNIAAAHETLTSGAAADVVIKDARSRVFYRCNKEGIELDVLPGEIPEEDTVVYAMLFPKKKPEPEETQENAGLSLWKKIFYLFK